MLKSPLSTRPVIEALEARIAPATFIVTTAADSGPGSLRQAILDANALSGADTINFDFEGDELQVISVLSQLPAITDQLTIQATVGEIRLDGSQAGDDVHGLILRGTTSSVISGLEIANFSGDGVQIEEGVSNVLSGNLIFSNGGNGVHIIGGQSNRLTGNTIGEAGWLNESAGNHLNGVLLENTKFNRIAYGNEWHEHQGNTIRSNGLFGVEVRGGAGGNQVWGNNISGNGVRYADGVNGGGIAIVDSPDNWLGGSVFTDFNNSAVRGNTVAENHGTGILISGPTSAHTRLFANSVTATYGDGIRIDGAPSTEVGSVMSIYTAGLSRTNMFGNTIKDSQGWNIAVLSYAAQTRIRGNIIEGGTLGGVLTDKVDSIQIGGTGAYSFSSDSNTFRNNLGDAITVRDGTGIRISSNMFTGNSGMPVDLGGDGPTHNDPADADTGANNLQNYPLITAVATELPSSSSFIVQVGGTLATGLTAGTYRIELYAWSPGNVYKKLSAFDVTTNAQGVAQVPAQSVFVPAGSTHVSAVAISASGDTSEFAPPTSIQPRLSVVGQIITEGDSAGFATVTVSLSFAPTEPVVVQYRTSDGTATASSDYSAVEGTITFAPGETQKAIQIPVMGDTEEELSENFHLDIISVAGASATNTRGTIQLTNDDGIPTINIEDATVIEGGTSSGSGTLEVKYKVTLSKPSLETVTVRLGTVSGGTATQSSSGDYYTGTTSVVFQPGQTEAYSILYIVDDAAREYDETVNLQLRDAQHGVIGQGNAVLTIADNDSWELQTDSVQIVEGNDGQRNALVTVRLVGVGPEITRNHIVSLNYATASGAATAGTDFSAVQGTLTFSPEESVQVISVPILGDSLPEPDEFLKVLFSSPLGATLPSPEAIITIEDDEPVGISITGGSITEGDSGTQLLTFTVSLTRPADGVVSVDYGTADQSAEAGSDYDAVDGQLVFAPGETSKTVTVPVRGDNLVEANELFLLRFINPSGAVLNNTEATGTIVNNDRSISVTGSSVLEGHTGSKSLVFTVSLSEPALAAVTVAYGTADGTAEAGSDYTAVSGTLTFAPGQQTKTITVPISGDTLVEGDETFTLALTSATGGSIVTGDAIGTILGDDLPTLSIQGSTVLEGHSGTTALVFTVTLSEPVSSLVTVEYRDAGGTASYSSSLPDYTQIFGVLTFEPGETTKTVAIPIISDLYSELDETVILRLESPHGAKFPTAPGSIQAQGTIINDDASPSEVGLTISKEGRKATWIDSDGDIVILTATKKWALNSWFFYFGNSSEGGPLLLQQLDIASRPLALGLKFTVQKSATGDGLVHVGTINAEGLDLTDVSLPGRLGSIIAGDEKLKTPAIRKLTVDSFGLDAAAAEAGAAPLLSEVNGSLGRFVVKQDYVGAKLVVTGGSVRSINIGGNLLGTSSSAPTGISVDTSLISFRVGGDIRGTDPLHPVEIKTAHSSLTRAAVALKTMHVTGDVIDTNVIAGANSQAAVSAGTIFVGGDWIASNLAVGAGSGPDELFGTDDDAPLQSVASRIARIVIRGAVTGTPEIISGSDHFGFVAGRIAAFQVGTSKMALSTKWKDCVEIGATSDVMIRELSGRVSLS